MKLLMQAVAGLGLAITTLSPAVAAPAASSAFMPGGEIADAPTGFIDMCQRDRELCNAGILPPAPEVPSCRASLAIPDLAFSRRLDWVCEMPAAAMVNDSVSALPPLPIGDGKVEQADRAAFKMVKHINSQVNRHIMQVSDKGDDDRWERPTDAGDCEDLAIEKRMRLIEAGFPPSRMFFAIAYKRGFGLHTLLVVRMDDGDWVLDSLAARVQRWDKIGYSWLRRQSNTDPMKWTRVTPGAQLQVADRTQVASAS